MKYKKLVMFMTAVLMVSSSIVGVNASATTTAMPVLISIQLEEIRGTFVSYEEGLLVVTVNEEEVSVAVNPEGETQSVKEVTEATYGAQFSKLQPLTLIDMMVTKGNDTTYILESLIAIHQVFMDAEPIPVLIAEPELINTGFNEFEVMYKEAMIEFDVQPQVINDRVMVPLRAIAESLGYDVVWNNDTRSVDLMKGPQFTSIYIDQNRYFRNKMAPSPLSAAPVIVDGRTLVPVEFVTEILGFGVEYKDGQMKIYDEPFATLVGYISEITTLDTYQMVYVAPRLGDDVEMWEQTVLIVNEDTMNNYGPLVEGDLIHGVHLPVMTMSIPGQTGAVIIY